MITTKNRRSRPIGPMKIRVNVTLFDLHDGIGGHCGACPIALAVIRAFSKRFRSIRFFHVSVTYKRIFIGLPEHTAILVVETTKTQQDFIPQFDKSQRPPRDGQMVPARPRPISFVVSLTAEEVKQFQEAA